MATEQNILAQFELKKLNSVPDIGDICLGNISLTNSFGDFPTQVGKEE